MGGSQLARAAPSAEDKATARALFDKGRELLAAGKALDACPKLEESQRLDPGVGTLYNLADCYEKVGRTASAWSIFLETASQAAASGQAAREKVARDRAERLRPKLSTLAIVAGDETLAGLQIKRDGKLVGRGQWGMPTPVDPGNHTVEAWAPGKARFSTSVQVGVGARSESVLIPTLQNAPPGTEALTSGPTSSSPADKSAAHGWQRPTALVAGGIGIVSVGLATVFAIRTRSRLDESSKWCDGGKCTDPRGVDLQNQAGTQADLATIFTSLGAAGLVAGGVLWLTAPRRSEASSATRSTPSVAVGPASLWFKGEW